jgi:hypothetical protein
MSEKPKEQSRMDNPETRVTVKANLQGIFASFKYWSFLLLDCSKITKAITKSWIEYSSPLGGFERTTLVVICTDCIRRCTSINYTILPWQPNLSINLLVVIKTIEITNADHTPLNAYRQGLWEGGVQPVHRFMARRAKNGPVNLLNKP